MPSDGDLTLTVGGVVLGGWKRIRVTRGIERVPTDFEIALTSNEPGVVGAFPVKRGQSCTVQIGGDLVCTGFVNQLLPALDCRQHEIAVAGRGLCQDLTDCTAEWPGGQISEADALAIATKLAQPYKIKVIGQGGSKPIPQFNLNLTESPWAIIERVTRFEALLAYELPDGSLYLGPVGTEVHASGAVQGVNILSGRGAFSDNQRFSEYYAYLSSTQVLEDIGQGGNLLAKATDPNVGRHRRHAFIAEAPSGAQDVCLERAQWEAARRLGRSSALTVTLDSWRDGAGRLWTPNMLVPVVAPDLGYPSARLLISEVTYLRDGAAGTRAALTLMPPQAYRPEPILLQPPLGGVGPNSNR
jgi:prophage tail gpP-like protein